MICFVLIKTRWVESQEAMLRFLDTLFPIIIFLEDTISNLDGSILSKCNGLLQSVLNFKFIFSLEIKVNNVTNNALAKIP